MTASLGMDPGLPEPPVPADADVGTLSTMRLDMSLLRRTEAWGRRTDHPDLPGYLLSLWDCAFHSVPAGSLPDEDGALREMAACRPERWADVRGVILEGWELHADGLLYHDLVSISVATARAAQLVAEAEERAASKRRGQAAVRQARHRALKAARPVSRMAIPDSPNREQGRNESSITDTSSEAVTRDSPAAEIGHSDTKPEAVTRDMARNALRPESSDIKHLGGEARNALREVPRNALRPESSDINGLAQKPRHALLVPAGEALIVTLLSGSVLPFPRARVESLWYSKKVSKKERKKVVSKSRACVRAAPAREGNPVENLRRGEKRLSMFAQYEGVQFQIASGYVAPGDQLRPGQASAGSSVPFVGKGHDWTELKVAIEEVCEAACLHDENWRGDWQTLINWLRGGYSLEDQVLPAIRDMMSKRIRRDPLFRPNALAFFNGRLADLYGPPRIGGSLAA